MTEINPATPAQAANPGFVPPAVDPNPSTAPAQNLGDNKEGKVTIDLKEYRDLQRAMARTKSFDKRVALQRKQAQPTINPDGSPADQEIVEKFNELETAKKEAERKVLQMEVRDKVRGLLDQEEFKVLPKSTRELILKNPSMLSSADSLEEAMIDIEDFVRDQVLSIEDKAEIPGMGGAQKHETPPVVSGGSPAPASAVGLEDLSKLTGPARSQAAIRNKMKQTRGF